MKNNILLKKQSKLRIICLLVSLSIVVFSCRNNTDNMNTEGGGTAIIKFNMVGIDEGSLEPLKVASLNGVATNSSREQLIKEIPYNKDYSLVATLTEKPIKNNNSAQASISNSIAAASTTTLLPATSQYTVMAFDENGNLVKSASYARSSQQQNMILDAGKTYTFVVVSNNSTSFSPPSRSRIDDMTDYLTSHQDFLYFKTTLTLKYGEQNYLDVVLKHVGIQISLTVDATPEMGNITSLGLGYRHVGASTMSMNDIITNNIDRRKVLSNANNIGFISASFPAGTFPSQIVTTQPFIISSGDADPANVGKTTFRFQGIQFNGGNTYPGFIEIPISNDRFLPGKSYNIKFTFQPTGVKVGNLIWAKGNLSYDWVNKIYFNRYYAYETGSNYKDTDYWNYGSPETPLVPKRIMPRITDAYNDPINAVSLPINDPCKLVAGGKWRMPTIADFASLGTYTLSSSNNFTQPNGTAGPPYIYFLGTSEYSGASTTLAFYASGRYYGVVTDANRAAGYTNGGNSAYIANAITSMASDAIPFWIGQVDENMRAEMPIIYSGSAATGNTFNTQRGIAFRDWSADDRVPIRCVKSVTP